MLGNTKIHIEYELKIVGIKHITFGTIVFIQNVFLLSGTLACFV